MATSAALPAKRPRSAVAGPYGHPLHPIPVTIPIGTWVASLVFDIASHAAGDATGFTRGATWLIAIGIVGALVAAVFGLMDLSVIPRNTSTFTIGLTHMSFNLVIVVLFAISFAMRVGADPNLPVATFPLVLSIIALVLLGVSGWLGGQLAYHYGVRVADERTQAEGYVPHTAQGRFRAAG